MSVARDLMRVAIEQARFEGMDDREIANAFDALVWENERKKFFSQPFSSGSMGIGGWPSYAHKVWIK